MPATGKSNNRQELKKNNSVMERLKEFFLGTDKSISITTLAIMLISLVIARLLLSMIRRCQLDADCYAYWSDYLITNNWKDFYQDISYAIYGTVYLYFMWITGHIMKVWQLFFVLINVVGGLFVYFVHKKVDKTNSKKLIPVFYSYIGLIITSIIVVLFLSSSDVPTIKGYMIKMWYVLFDIIGGILIYKIGKRCNKERLGALIGAVYILNPGIFVNSSMWGQLDTIIATMMLLSIYLLSTKRMLAGVAMVVVSLMTKPQAIVVLPVAGVLFLALLPWEKASSNKSWFIKKSLYAIVSSILVALAVYTVLFLPFTIRMFQQYQKDQALQIYLHLHREILLYQEL